MGGTICGLPKESPSGIEEEQDYHQYGVGEPPEFRDYIYVITRPYISYSLSRIGDRDFKFIFANWCLRGGDIHDEIVIELLELSICVPLNFGFTRIISINKRSIL